MIYKPARRPRILIVDDEPMIAIDLESVLLDEGFEIAGIAGNLEKALSIVESGVFDVAIIDANLNGVSAAPIAVAMAARGLPFLVLSGYALEQLATALRAGGYLQKPANPAQIVKVLNQMVSEMLS
jgi:DNA-binding response OmpR family regulator